MKNIPSPNPLSGGDDQPITIRINLLIRERPNPSGSGRPASPRISNSDNNDTGHNNRISSGSVPLTGGADHPGHSANLFSRRAMMPGSGESQPVKNPALVLEGALDRNRLKDLLREPTSAAEPDIEITLVLYL